MSYQVIIVYGRFQSDAVEAAVGFMGCAREKRLWVPNWMWVPNWRPFTIIAYVCTVTVHTLVFHLRDSREKSACTC